MELGAFSSWYGRTSLPHYSRPSPRRHRRHPSTRYPYHGDYTIHRSHQEVIIPPVPFAVIHPPASTTVPFFVQGNRRFHLIQGRLDRVEPVALYRGSLRHLLLIHRTTVAGHPPRLPPS